jgi:pyruvate dehydrogenase (quinone)
LLPKVMQRTDSSFHDTYVVKHQHVKRSQAEKCQPGPHGKIPGMYLAGLINRYAKEDALFSADDGTPVVWLHRLIEANGKRRMFGSMLHGTMANGLGTAIGLQKAQPDRQVICMSGDGGISMLFGDLMTLVQENAPVKVAVFNNGKLGFVELEQKSEGLLPIFTTLKNPDFGKVADALGLWGRTVTKADTLEDAVQEWLAVPGPALLNVTVEHMELVMPPMIEFGPAYGMTMYSIKAVMHGKGGDIFDMVQENLP